MIQKAYQENIQEIMKIWLDTNIQAHSFLPKSYWEENYELVEKQYLPQAETYIYYKDNKILGFISIIDKTFIGALFIDIEYQNQGIGKKLLDYCKNIYPSLSLAVYKENKNAVQFYQKNGFMIQEEHPNESSGAPELIMFWKKN